MYGSIDEALFYAAQAAREASKNEKEAMTVIYQLPDGKFNFANPVGSGQSSKVRAKLSYPREAKLVAMMHNHPPSGISGDSDARLMSRFSEDDVQAAKGLGIMSAITYGPDMQIRVFNPSKDPVRNVTGSARELGQGRVYADGNLMNEIPEVKVTAKRVGPIDRNPMAAVSPYK
jgi:hypothetical protein